MGHQKHSGPSPFTSEEIGEKSHSGLVRIADVPELTLAKSEPKAVSVDLGRPSLPSGWKAKNRYLQSRLLGVGGMGEVRLCHDEVVGRDVAMKLMSVSEPGADAKLRFLQEAQVQGQLQHPGVVPVYDIGALPDGTLFFTMKRLRGKTLKEILYGLRLRNADMEVQFPLHRLLRAFASVCIALDYAHARGVIHRDIKPENIMLGDFDEVYLLDWGLAKLRSESDIRRVSAEHPLLGPKSVSNPEVSSGRLFGTLGYMAPEQVEGTSAHVDARSDVFALGAILFEILTLERLRPLASEEQMLLTVRQKAEARPSVRAPERQVPPELEEICVRATQNRPADRYPSARMLYDAIQRFLFGERDVELRRQLAYRHLGEAEFSALAAVGLGESAITARKQTLQTLSRALALDPENQEALRLFHRLLRSPPKQIPAEVAEKAAAHQTELEQRRNTMYVREGFLNLLLVPLILLMGVREVRFLILWLTVLAANWGIRRYMLTLSNIPSRFHYAAHLLQLLLCGMMGRFFGPLFMITALLAVSGTLNVLHSADKRFRLFAITTTCLVPLSLLSLEWLGILSPSYAFRDGAMIILPTVVNHPRLQSLLFLISMTLISIILPALSVAKMTEKQRALQNRMLLQDWHLRQLVPQTERPPVEPDPNASSSETIASV